MDNKKFEKYEEVDSLVQHFNDKFIESIKKNLMPSANTNMLERQMAKKKNEAISKEMAKKELHDLGVIYLNEDMIEQFRAMPDVDQEKVERLAFLYDIVVEKPVESEKELKHEQELEKITAIIEDYFTKVEEGVIPKHTVYLPNFFVEEVPSAWSEPGGKCPWHGISTRLNNVLYTVGCIYPLLFVTAKDLKKYFRQWGKVAITEFEQLLEKYGYSLGCKDLTPFSKKLDGVEYAEIKSEVLEKGMFEAWIYIKNPKLIKEYIAKRMQLSQER